MTTTVTVIKNRHDPNGHPIVLRAGQRVTFGTGTAIDVPLRSPTGDTHPHISGEAGLIGVTQEGRAIVQNLSKRHDIVVRAYGEHHDVPLPPAPATRNRAAHCELSNGWWWIRNGRALTTQGRTRHPTDAETSWLLVHVSGSTSAVTFEITGTIPLDDPVAPVPRHELTEAHVVTIAMIFQQFLAAPPRVSPTVYSDPDVREIWNIEMSRRRSELRNIAGIVGRNLDANWITNLLRTGRLTYDMIWRSKHARRILNLSAPPR